MVQFLLGEVIGEAGARHAARHWIDWLTGASPMPSFAAPLLDARCQMSDPIFDDRIFLKLQLAVWNWVGSH